MLRATAPVKPDVERICTAGTLPMVTSSSPMGRERLLQLLATSQKLLPAAPVQDTSAPMAGRASRTAEVATDKRKARRAATCADERRCFKSGTPLANWSRAGLCALRHPFRGKRPACFALNDELGRRFGSPDRLTPSVPSSGTQATTCFTGRSPRGPEGVASRCQNCRQREPTIALSERADTLDKRLEVPPPKRRWPARGQARCARTESNGPRNAAVISAACGKGRTAAH
jgi:hypothetical protein